MFLSFRGEDTRGTFTAHLCDALWRRAINTFIDGPKLRKGQLISPALLIGIENSMFCIIVLSTNYASSSWCLKELVKILESKTCNPERVLPIFHNVDPSDVKKQEGEFGKPLERLVENLTDPETEEQGEDLEESSPTSFQYFWLGLKEQVTFKAPIIVISSCLRHKGMESLSVHV